MADKMVPCSYCKGDGFITDLAMQSTPCPICQGEGEVPQSGVSGPGKPGEPPTQE